MVEEAPYMYIKFLCQVILSYMYIVDFCPSTNPLLTNWLWYVSQYLSGASNWTLYPRVYYTEQKRPLDKFTVDKWQALAIG